MRVHVGSGIALRLGRFVLQIGRGWLMVHDFKRKGDRPFLLTATTRGARKRFGLHPDGPRLRVG